MNEHLDFNGQGDSKQKINSAEARNEPPVDYLPDVASKASVSVPKRIVAWLLIAVILGTGIIAFLYNFVLFPSVYEGLMRALEPKFELGLVYDLENMADGGHIELYADGLADSRVFGSSLSATLDYDCENGHIRLQPENSTMDPIIVDDVTILGKVVSLYRVF